jgi:hypothetical protein
VTALEESLGFTRDRPARAASPASGVLPGLGNAVAGRRRVALAYRSWRGGQSRRELDPYGPGVRLRPVARDGHDHRGDAGTETFEVPLGFDSAKIAGPRRGRDIIANQRS